MVNITGTVEIIKNGETVYKGNNTVTHLGEDFLASLLQKSFVLGNQYDNTEENYVDYVGIGAGYKLAQDGADVNKLVLPYSPVDGAEASDFYAGKRIKCISGVNAGEEREVASYDATTREITTTLGFPNTPKTGDIYVIETDKREIQLQGEGQPDGNGDIIANTRKAVVAKNIGLNLNEVIYEATWDVSDGKYVIVEAGYFYNLDSALDGNSANHTPSNQKMFSRLAMLDNPIYKGDADEVTIRWTFRIGDPR